MSKTQKMHYVLNPETFKGFIPFYLAWDIDGIFQPKCLQKETRVTDITTPCISDQRRLLDLDILSLYHSSVC